MIEVQTAHTADLDPAALAAARALLDEAFAGDFDEHDWEHSLGGVHALVWEGDAVVGHAAVVQRRLLHGGRALRAGYVEGVGVRADRRRHGYGGGDDDGGRAHRARGVRPRCPGRHRRRRGRLHRARLAAVAGAASVLTPDGLVRTEEEDGAVYVLPVAVPLDLSGELTCDWRDGDVW